MIVYVVKWNKVCCFSRLYSEEETRIFQNKEDAEKFKKELFDANKKLCNDFNPDIRIIETELL